jgi:hypothetical protein
MTRSGREGGGKVVEGEDGNRRISSSTSFESTSCGPQPSVWVVLLVLPSAEVDVSAGGSIGRVSVLGDLAIAAYVGTVDALRKLASSGGKGSNGAGDGARGGGMTGDS